MTTHQKITLGILVTLMALYLAYDHRQKIAPSLYGNVAGIYPTVIGTPSAEIDIGKTICNPKWSTKQVRPSTSYTTPLKNKLAKEQGVDPKDFELDHALPIEILGDPTDPNNLWLEPYNLTVDGIPAGARQKDAVENLLKREVCNGQITLKKAQFDVVNNWFEIYKKQIVGKFGSVNESDEDDN